MRQFNITVNGIGYQVSLEEVAVGSVAPAAPAAPVAIPAPVAVAAPVAPVAPVAAPAVKPAAAAVAGGTKINSPMPGTIMDIRCKPGDTIKRGHVLLILEAMKMENEIISPVDGTVKLVAVTKGASVGSGDLMVVIG
jgi:glutaconyl-CoA/methylmalonyl-CoA decarboxylase subunit gamma